MKTTKNPTGFFTLNGNIWQVIEKIRQRQLQSQNLTKKKRRENDQKTQ